MLQSSNKRQILLSIVSLGNRKSRLIYLLLLLLSFLSVAFLTSRSQIIELSKEGSSMDVTLFPGNIGPSIDTFQPNKEGVCEGSRWPQHLPPIYVITATHVHPGIIAELTRTGQTLLHVDALVWIIVEDTHYRKPSPLVQAYLKSSRLCHVYLTVSTEYTSRKYHFHEYEDKPRGVAHRNAGIKWVRENAEATGVLYFGDADYTYDVRIFSQMRKTKKVSMFPVGLASSLGISSPIVQNGSVIGYYDIKATEDTFPIDMAGFAVNVRHLLKSTDPEMVHESSNWVTIFIEKLKIKMKDIEALAENCTKIFVWHTRNVRNPQPKDPLKRIDVFESNIQDLKMKLLKHNSRSKSR